MSTREGRGERHYDAGGREMAGPHGAGRHRYGRGEGHRPGHRSAARAAKVAIADADVESAESVAERIRTRGGRVIAVRADSRSPTQSGLRRRQRTPERRHHE